MKTVGISSRKHFEHCFAFQIPQQDPPFVGDLDINMPREVLEQTRGWLILGIHTGSDLSPSSNTFRLCSSREDLCVVTFDSLAAFFPRKWTGNKKMLREILDVEGVVDARIMSYLLASPVLVPARSNIIARLRIVEPCSLSVITITCAGICWKQAPFCEE